MPQNNEKAFVVLVLLKYTLFVTQKMQERIIIILDIEWILDIERVLELVSTIEYRIHGQRPADVHIVTMRLKFHLSFILIFLFSA